MREAKKLLAQGEKAILARISKMMDEKLAEKKPAEPKDEKKKHPGFMGIQTASLSEEESKDLGIEGGAKVVSALEDMPAAKAGIQSDDIIVSIDKTKVSSAQDLVKIISEKEAGTKVKVEYMRDGKKRFVTVTLAQRPVKPEEMEKKEDNGDEDDK